MEKITFKYHPNIYEEDILVHKNGACQCCGKSVSEYIEHLYASEDVDCICLQCVSDGSAAEKFDAEFIADAEPVSDPKKRTNCFIEHPDIWDGRMIIGLRAAMIIVSIWDVSETQN